jgi:hypothetical protein
LPVGTAEGFGGGTFAVVAECAVAPRAGGLFAGVTAVDAAEAVIPTDAVAPGGADAITAGGAALGVADAAGVDATRVEAADG